MVVFNSNNFKRFHTDNTGNKRFALSAGCIKEGLIQVFLWGFNSGCIIHIFTRFKLLNTCSIRT